MFIKIGNKAYPYEEIKSLKVECGKIVFGNISSITQKSMHFSFTGEPPEYPYWSPIDFDTTIDISVELKSKDDIEFISIPHNGVQRLPLKSKDKIEQEFIEEKDSLAKEIEDYISDNFIEILKLNDNFLIKSGEKYENNR